MKICEISMEAVVDYLRVEDFYEDQIKPIMEAAKQYISSYTGLPITSEIEGGESIDSFDDLYYPFMVLCQQIYDNRSVVESSNNANKLIDSILGIHSRNLL